MFKSRLLLADDHDLVRDILTVYLEKETDIEVTAASDFHEVISYVGKSGPYDLVLLDYNMPGMNGPASIKQCLEQNFGKPVAILSGDMTKELGEQMISAGASGALTKGMEAKTLINAIKFMLAGEIYFPTHLLKSKQEKAGLNPEKMGLSGREMDVLEGLNSGLSNKEIARKLDIQEVTVKLHVKNICRKLDAKNRTHAAILAKETGLI